MDNLSIGIATYKRPKLLERCLQSILEQEIIFQYEIIVVNDTPLSNKLFHKEYDSIIEKYKTILPLNYYVNSKNLGLSETRNNLINYSKFDWFTFIDDDDSYHVNAFKNLNLNAYSMYDSIMIFSNKKFDKKEYSLKELMFLGVTPPVASQIYKLKLLESIAPYNVKVKSGVDHDLWINLFNKNVNVIIETFEWANTNQDYELERITTSEKRNELIKKSISLWSNILPKNFLNYFSTEYKYYLYNRKILDLYRNNRKNDFLKILLVSKLRYKINFIMYLYRVKYKKTAFTFKKFKDGN